jgi:hypothetical protein
VHESKGRAKSPAFFAEKPGKQGIFGAESRDFAWLRPRFFLKFSSCRMSLSSRFSHERESL